METYSKAPVIVPHGWTLDFHRKFIGPHSGDYDDDLNQPILKRKGTFAAACTNFEAAHEIELRSNYNGSGPTAFNGAKQWPCVTSRVSFEVDEYEKAAQFAHDLGEFIDTWMTARGR